MSQNKYTVVCTPQQWDILGNKSKFDKSGFGQTTQYDQKWPPSKVSIIKVSEDSLITTDDFIPEIKRDL